jgi:hypothetical protein
MVGVSILYTQLKEDLMFDGIWAKARQGKHVLIAITAAVIMLMVVVAPAFAITFGEPDGNAHPYVGSMVIRDVDGTLYQVCSGTLIAPQVFLTASHCTYGLEEEVAAELPGAEILVTFDPVIDENATYYTGELVTNPNYNPVVGENDASDTGDVAVILLDQSPGIDPASLPTLGLLDQLKSSGTLKNTRFTAVGYGTVRETKGGGWKALLDNMERRRVDQSFLSLTKAWLTLSMNPSTGSGGTCYGDSGGPHFIHLGGNETDIVVSVTVTGDAVCRATDKTYRIDTAESLAFLSQYVAIP